MWFVRRAEFWATCLTDSDSFEVCYLCIWNFFLYPILFQILLTLNLEEIMPTYIQREKKNFLFLQSIFTYIWLFYENNLCRWRQVYVKIGWRKCFLSVSVSAFVVLFMVVMNPIFMIWGFAFQRGLWNKYIRT